MEMWVVWLIITAIFLVVEAVTMGLTTIWCAAGSVVALLLDLCGVGPVGQVVAFVLVSAALFVVFLFWIKPALKGKNVIKTIPTNADRIIGQEAVVIEAINPIDGTGQIKVLGQVWSAVADSNIEKDSKVQVTAISGVKAVVSKM